MLVSPFTAQAATKQRCTASLVDKIRNLNIRRLQSPDLVKPKEGVCYFPVYNDDFFHRHGDPDFIDFSPVECVSDDGIYVLGDDDIAFMSLFNIVVEPTVIEPENEAIAFQLNYGENHSHLINSQTLRNKLAL